MMRWLAKIVMTLVAVWAVWPAHTASAQGRIVGRHGDWQIRCEQPVGSPSEQCALVQNVEAQDRANVGLTVIFLRTADRQARILRVLAPLGVLLPSGLGLSIDDNEVGLAGFVRCLPEGCIAEVELDDGLLERFAAGTTATFVIFQTPEEGIGIPISLDGFTNGFAALDNPPPPASVDEGLPAVAPEAVTTTVEAPVEPAAPSQSIPIEADERTEFERMLEDPMLPYVAAGLVLILAIVIVLVLVLRGRGKRNAQPAYAPPPPLTPEPADGLDALQTETRAAPRQQPRLAAAPKRRQLAPYREDDPHHDPAPPGPPRG